MAGSKEIRTKIKSVENTRKITRAMEMVAAAKMRKAQERMRAARPRRAGGAECVRADQRTRQIQGGYRDDGVDTETGGSDE